MTSGASWIIGVDTRAAVQSVAKLGGAMNNLGRQARGLTLPFLGGIGLSSILGANMLSTAEQAGRLGSGFYDLSDAAYRLKLGIGTALGGALEQLAPLLTKIINLLVDEEGNLKTGGWIAVIGTAALISVTGVVRLGGALLGVLRTLRLIGPLAKGVGAIGKAGAGAAAGAGAGLGLGAGVAGGVIGSAAVTAGLAYLLAPGAGQFARDVAGGRNVGDAAADWNQIGVDRLRGLLGLDKEPAPVVNVYGSPIATEEELARLYQKFVDESRIRPPIAEVRN